MRFNRVTYPINAIALDAATSTSAIDGELDRKVLTRYVFPVVIGRSGGVRDCAISGCNYHHIHGVRQ